MISELANDARICAMSLTRTQYSGEMAEIGREPRVKVSMKPIENCSPRNANIPSSGMLLARYLAHTTSSKPISGDGAERPTDSYLINGYQLSFSNL